ncbi:unnamed protein product, partial [Polarella glacialis]
HGFPGSAHRAAGQYARPPPAPKLSVWQILRQRRAWVRGGMVHRSSSSLLRSFIGAWPFWLILSAFTLGRVRQGPVQYDADGQAYVRDLQSGSQWRRTPHYDDIPD